MIEILFWVLGAAIITGFISFVSGYYAGRAIEKQRVALTIIEYMVAYDEDHSIYP